MVNIFAIVMLISLLCLIIGLFRPPLVIRWEPNEKKTRLRVFFYFGSVTLLSLIFILGSLTAWFFLIEIFLFLLVIFALVVFCVSPVFFVLGLIKPKLALWWSKKPHNRKRVGLYSGAAFVVSLICIITIVSTVEPEMNNMDDDIIMGTYSGDLNDNDEKHGEGKIENNSGFYEGQWENNVRSGYGEQFIKFGMFLEMHYEGEWKNDLPTGQGKQGVKMLWFNVTYEGEFKEDLRHGQGRFVDRSGNIYEGQWEKDQPNGFGESILSNGETYIGEWKDWERHGEGKVMKNGEVIHEGTFVEDEFQE